MAAVEMAGPKAVTRTGVVTSAVAGRRAVKGRAVRQAVVGLGVHRREVGTGARDQAETGPGLQGHAEVAKENGIVGKALEDAVLNVVFHEQNADLVDAAANCHDLCQHLFAIAAGVQHSLQTLDLALDPA
jgi:hypothetical protein